ncbi:MAG: 50S ribosomal protein L15 [Planctomycetaceae bacterium]|jgi:large subunit ribosomal protein L15|nr:50S ribosomal protein L15 [Planctomycetaceae bacterium]
MTSISEINHNVKAARKPRRVGRGTGSGRGKTSQRGHKGQGSRSGSSMSPIFEGGQMPLVRRIPKRGFNNKTFADKIIAINVGDLAECFVTGDTIDPAILTEKKFIRKTFDKIKVLGDGDLTIKLNVSAHAFSKTAKDKIEKAGGTINILPDKKPVVKNKMGFAKKAKLQAVEKNNKR